MKRKIIAIGLISMFLLTGLTAFSAMGTKVKNADDSWIKITKPIDGSTFKIPLVIESEGSEDIDYVEYALYYHGCHHSGFRVSNEKPFHVKIWIIKDLQPNDIIKITACAYEKNENGVSHLIATSPEITITYKKNKSIHPVFLDFFEMFSNLFSLLQRLLLF